MPWVKLDDGFLTNPKVMRAGLQGRAIYVAGLCYCAGGLTDGFVPAEAVGKLGSLADVKKPVDAVLHLVEVGLWEPAEGGYRIHDYLKYQPSAEDVRKERERVKAWRTNRVRNDVQNAFGTASRANDVPARPVPNGDGDVRKSPARARAPDEPAARRAPPSSEEPPPLRPEQQQCPLCPEVFPDNAALREHIDTSPRHKVRPKADDLRVRRPSSSNQPPPDVTPDEVAAELQAMKDRTQTITVPAELLAEHERRLAYERARVAVQEGPHS